MQRVPIHILIIAISLIFYGAILPQNSGNVIFFDGDNDGVIVEDINSSLDSLSHQITIEAWVYGMPPFNSNYPRIVDRSDNNTFDRWLFCINLNVGGPQLNINNNELSAISMIYNDWVHIAASYDSSSRTIYMNGELVESYKSSYLDIIDVTNSDIYIGNNHLLNRSLHGAIDELRIWNTARSKEQIKQTMYYPLDENYLASADSGLIAYWQFDTLYQVVVANDTLLQVKDISYNENHGILFGDAALISPNPQLHTLLDFDLIEPENDQTLDTNSPVFKWQQPSLKKVYYPKEIQYEIYIDDNETFDSPHIEKINGDSSLTVDNLLYNTTYFWKVRAENIAGDTLWSSSTNGFYISSSASKLDLISVEDVPDDNGGWVSLEFVASPFDTDTATTPEQYQIEYLKEMQWITQKTIAAKAKSIYQETVGTKSDSGSEGNAVFQYRVVAYMDEGIFISDTLSGYSKDNLAPAAPVGLYSNYSEGSNVNLQWQSSPETDLKNYRVYRSQNDQPFQLIDQTIDTTYIDSTVVDDMEYQYAVSAVDSSGNEGQLSDEINLITHISTESILPDSYYLHQNYPNPFNPMTSIRFGIVKSNRVAITIYDTAGRVIKTLLNKELPAGHHIVSWNGKNIYNSPVSSGLYFYKIEAEDFIKVRKMILLK